MTFNQSSHLSIELIEVNSHVYTGIYWYNSSYPLLLLGEKSLDSLEVLNSCLFCLANDRVDSVPCATQVAH